MYGRVFYKAFEQCHHTLNIQLNCLSVLTVLILYEGTYLVPETQTDPPHLVSVLTFLLHLGLKFHQCTRSLHRTSCIYFAMLLPHSIISYRCSEKANVTVCAQLFFKVAFALGKLEWMIFVLNQWNGIKQGQKKIMSDIANALTYWAVLDFHFWI